MRGYKALKRGDYMGDTVTRVAILFLKTSKTFLVTRLN